MTGRDREQRQTELSEDQEKFIDSLQLPALEAAAKSLFSHIGRLAISNGTPVMGLLKPPILTDQLADQVIDPTAVEAVPSTFEMVWEMAFSWNDILAGNYARLIKMLVEQGLDLAIESEKHLLQFISAGCEAAGTSIDARGRKFSHDMLLDMIETTEIQFDEDGRPEEGRAWVFSPDVARAVSALPPPTPDQARRHKRIMEEKRTAWIAKQRHRRLPR